MHICFDLDNTLFLDRALTKASQELGYPYTQAYHVDWDMEFFPQEIRSRVKELWVDPEYMTSLVMYPGTDKFLEHIQKDLGHTVSVVTARAHHLKDCSESMIHERFGSHIPVHVVGMGVDKVSLLKQNQCDLWVDDSPAQVMKTLEAGIPTILITNDNTKYNWHRRSEPGIVCRVNVADIEDALLTKIKDRHLVTSSSSRYI
jgi:5'(3')-deoxyribonucleotidase